MLDKLDTDQIIANVRSVRLLRGIKADDIARQLGISKSSYSDIETGKCDLTVKRMQRIADILNVSYELLISKNALGLQKADEKKADQTSNSLGSDVIHNIVKTQESIVHLVEQLSEKLSPKQNQK